ncbi:hypothetical protein SISNIDRAFT_282398 [Sistotremastrum niveocremeum HHB9708]|uniref:Uncharacterized protein n=1 Tax=Sistotremastrum niveocremeum HHB9708 TaxID=1314777 RepID=A0A164Y7W8_9AGAM|nr:hypothetical protein SISNIDRAFT_282398 [Sistotremastrum niveocremeum HHB9708]
MSELDVDESRLHQGAASQAPALYSLQSHNVTPRHLIIETDTSCSPAVIESIPMMPKFRTDIASLPIEMLLHILKLYYLYFWDDPPNGTVKDLQWWLILNVCSTWRQLVLDTPFFWQKIWSHWHPEIVNLLEMRSKPYSLTIRRSPLGGPGFGDQNYDVEGNATARLLTTHMDRIRSLDIEWLETLWLADVNTHEKMYNLISRCVADAAFPKLTEVFLGSCTYYRAKRSMKLNAPKLKFLILQELVLDSTSYPYLANLTSLRLRTANLTAEDIIPLVEACPRLEYCNIRTEQKTTHHVLPEPQPLPTHRVPLRALEYLNISGLQWLSLARTLDHLEICPTANINLKLPPAERHGDHPQDVFRETITPFIPSYDSLEISGHAIMLRNSARPGSLAFNSDDSDHSVLASLSEKLTYFSFLMLASISRLSVLQR